MTIGCYSRPDLWLRHPTSGISWTAPLWGDNMVPVLTISFQFWEQLKPNYFFCTFKASDHYQPLSESKIWQMCTQFVEKNLCLPSIRSAQILCPPPQSDRAHHVTMYIVPQSHCHLAWNICFVGNALHWLTPAWADPWPCQPGTSQIVASMKYNLVELGV